MQAAVETAIPFTVYGQGQSEAGAWSLFRARMAAVRRDHQNVYLLGRPAAAKDYDTATRRHVHVVTARVITTQSPVPEDDLWWHGLLPAEVC